MTTQKDVETRLEKERDANLALSELAGLRDQIEKEHWLNVHFRAFRLAHDAWINHANACNRASPETRKHLDADSHRQDQDAGPKIGPLPGQVLYGNEMNFAEFGLLPGKEPEQSWKEPPKPTMCQRFCSAVSLVLDALLPKRRDSSQRIDFTKTITSGDMSCEIKLNGLTFGQLRWALQTTTEIAQAMRRNDVGPSGGK